MNSRTNVKGDSTRKISLFNDFYGMRKNFLFLTYYEIIKLAHV